VDRLTKTVVEGAALPERRAGEGDAAYAKRWTWLGDGEVPGFGVKVYGGTKKRPGGRKVYALRYRTTGGRQRMTTLGDHGVLTVKQARDRARAEKVRVLDGEDPQAEKQREAASIGTVGVLLTRWVDDYAKAHRKRWEEDEGRVDRHIRPKLGKLRLEDLTRDVLASWHRTLGKKTPVEANRALETLRAAWRWAEGEGLLPDGLTDPTKSVKKFRERSRDRWLSKAEVQRLMEAVKAEDDPYVRAAVPLFLLTGLRRRELLGARWADIDFTRGELTLHETKTGVAQVRLLTGRAVSILRELPRMEESPYVFPSPADSTKPRDGLKKPWERIREAAGLAGVTLHDLRRTAGSHLAQAGVSIQVIGEVLGHSHPGVTKLYARLSSENERKALDTLGDILAGPLGLSNEPKGSEALPDQLVALVEATRDDPEALAAGLLKLGLGKAVEA
jgi:integrase